MTNTNDQNILFEGTPIYNLEERTFQFAKEVRLFVRKLKRNIYNQDDHVQFLKASGSVEANYIEANESLGKKDFSMRIKISRKEAKESAYWLRLILETESLEKHLYDEGQSLFNEANELKKIFSSILLKSQ